MRISLLTNGHQICDYIAQDGVDISTITRNEKSITTLDGTLYMRNVEKIQLNITCLDMSDSQWKTLCSYLTPSPITLSYTNLDNGTTITGQFYVKDKKRKAKKTIGSLTYMTGLSFTLEEK